MDGAIWLAVGLAWMLSILPTAVRSDCAMGSSTLTTEGCTGCNDYAVCLGYSSADECTGSGCETVDDCTFECMNVSDATPTLVVLIEFGGYKSSQEVAAIRAGSYSDDVFDSYPDVTSYWPSVNNDNVTAVSTIDMPSTVSTFVLSGGTASVEYPKGKVASVTFTSDFILSDTSVTKVTIQNLDLESQTESLATLLPSSVQTIDLANTLLTSFPTRLGSLPSLKQLLVDNNYVTSVDALNVIDSISTLSLENNNINTFTGVFSNLSYLYLGSNNLSSVPTVIYSHSSLKLLNLTGNPISCRDFSRKQADFLNNLETLVLSESDFTIALECDDIYQVTIHDVTVCLSDGASTTSGNTNMSGSDIAGSTAGIASVSESSFASMIVGLICSSIILLIALILFIVNRSRRMREAKVSSCGEHSPSSDANRQERQQRYGQLDTSTGIPIGIPIIDDGVATSPHDVVMGLPTDDSDSTYPGSLPVVGKKKANTFLSIWTDAELLSLQVREEDIEDIKPLGSGASATVWLVRYRDSQLLASKRLRPERRQKQHVSTFVDEIKLNANFEHPNLVKLIGAAWTIESDLQALLEYMDGGDLRQYLADTNTPFGWTFRKFDIALGVIEALVYLHSFVPPLIHRDLKSKNVLLSQDFTAKLSDFGTSRFRSMERTMTAGVGTGRWLAPEVIRGDTDYGCAADIYSFGALLTELDTNQIPYSNTRNSNGKKLSDMTILHRVATGKLHPQVRSTCGPELRALVERCLAESPADRPTATVIAYELRVVQKKMAASL